MTTAALRYRSRALSAAAVLLPVPLLAALGLALPLPATVARLAARLVPFADESAVDAGRTVALARGTIIARPGETGIVRAGSHSASGHGRVLAGPRTRVKPTEPVAGHGRAAIARTLPEPALLTELPVAPAPATTQRPRGARDPEQDPTLMPTSEPPPQSTPAPAPAPAQQVVDTVTTAVDNTVSNTAATATAVVNQTAPVIGGPLGGKH